MLYLKRFNESFSNDDYYVGINKSDFRKVLSINNNRGDNSVKLSQSEVNYLRNNIYQGYVSHGRGRWCCDFIISDTRKRNWSIRIHKMKDDWFYVSCSHHPSNTERFFKCDQLDGVTKLIELISKQ